MKNKNFNIKAILIMLICVMLTTVPVLGKGKFVNDSFKLSAGYIYIDNKQIDGESLTYNAVTYLPIRKIAETVGLSVVYDNVNNRIDLTTSEAKSNTTVIRNKYTKTKTDTLIIDGVDVYLNGKLIQADNIIYNGTTYLPLREIGEALGLNVNYDSKTNNINLNSKDINSKNKVNVTNNTLKPVLTKEEISYPSEPETVDDFKKVLLYMANNNLTELDLTYKGGYTDLFVTNKDRENNMYTAFQTVYSEYVDLFSGVERISKTYRNEEDGEHVTITIHLSGVSVDGKTFIETQNIFEQEAYLINATLKKNGTIKSGMTQREIAKVLYNYVDKTLVFDYGTENGSNVNRESYLGYGAVTNKTAVCQGYTALYNYLLKLNGIKCYGQSGYLNNGVLHIWTVATLDGEKTYIDTTFGDTSKNKAGDVDYKYFDITKEELSKDRTGVN